MNLKQIYNVNILSESLLPSPESIKKQVPLSEVAAKTVFESRRTIQTILDRQDRRIFVILGPCSIHDLKSAKEYAKRLRSLAEAVKESFFLVMRVYFEKPRTSVGWKGFINDPDLDDSFNINKGVLQARALLSDIAEMGLPTGTEALDPIMPQYLHDLISWTAIGARTTESQTHREMASGLSTPVGFKNGTDGNIKTAINALSSISQAHHFLGINAQGQCSVMHTRGNKYGHLVLRGGSRPNYDAVNITLCESTLENSGLPVNIVVDCSHGNSLKDPARQPYVFENCVNQIMEGNTSIVGLMLESHLNAGQQSIPSDLSELKYGTSITDGCIAWETTEKLLLDASKSLAEIIHTRTRT